MINYLKMFCRKKSNIEACVASQPQMTAKEIIAIQLQALAKNDRKKSGILVAYHYASPECKQRHGSLYRFINLLSNNTYKHLLNNIQWKFVGKPHFNPSDTKMSQDIKVLSQNGKWYRYRFFLSRQYDWENKQAIIDPYDKTPLELYWRTDNVQLKEGFKGSQRGGVIQNQKNILGEPLEVCSLKPLTGYFRDGYCRKSNQDLGDHVVCAQVSQDYLKDQKRKGNDLMTPVGSFKGLKDGDYWCLCSGRYQQGIKSGFPLKLKKKATHISIKSSLDKSDF